MKIHYITPYSTEKNFGKAINEQISIIPDTDWVCMLDGDVMFLTPDWGRQIDEVVRKYGNKYKLFGCLTNRLGRPTQRYKGEFSENFDIKHHYNIAKELEQSNWAEVHDVTTKKKIAGMFMLFSKKTWNSIKFEENNPNFDDAFSNAIIKSGGKLGLLSGLYVFHCYRLWSNTPGRDRDHLLSK